MLWRVWIQAIYQVEQRPKDDHSLLLKKMYHLWKVMHQYEIVGLLELMVEYENSYEDILRQSVGYQMATSDCIINFIKTDLQLPLLRLPPSWPFHLR